MTFDEIPNSKIPGRGSWYNISFFKLDQNEFFHFGIKRSLFPPKTFATDEPLTVYDISPIKKSENCFAKVSYIEKTKRTNPSRPPNPPHGPPQGPPHGPSPSCLCNKDGSFQLISLSDNNDCSDKVTVAVAFQAGDWLVFFNVDDKRDAVIFPKSAIITEPYTPTNLAGLGSDDKNGQVFPIGKLVNPSNGTMQYNSSKDDGPQNHHNDPNHPNDSHGAYTLNTFC